MAKRVIIIGNHPVAESLKRQYEARGYHVEQTKRLSTEGIDCNAYDELCLLSDANDDMAVAMLQPIAAQYAPADHGGRKLTCHLLLETLQTLRMLQTTDLCMAIRQKADVYPFTMAEVWCRSIVTDYRPVTLQSEQHVHVVVFGMGQLAEMVAIHVALVAHYPNYVRNHTLRTRITMVDEQAIERSKAFVGRYQHLFDNSYYRLVKPRDEKAVVALHHPVYAGKREDFVDVEWEFVEAESWDAELRDKLKLWARDERQLLSIVMASEDADSNTAQALCLPSELYEQAIPIYKYSPQTEGYDVRLPLVRMAKNVNYVYDCCYEENDRAWSGQLRYATEIDREARERSWDRLGNVKRMSSIYNAMTIPAKMRSIGLGEEDWDRFYDIPQQDIELLAEVEHNRWSVEELILGFRPCTDEEQEAIAADVKTQKGRYKERKIHYDLRAYNDLRPDGTGKPVQVYDRCLSACLPLIAKAFADEEGGEA